MPSTCSQLKQDYEHLKALKAAFALEYAKVRESGGFDKLTESDLTRAKELMRGLEAARDALREKLIILHEKKRLKQFFGKDIEVPPLPKGITSEMIQVWETNRFKLEYWPKIDMQEGQNFPGWKHKPGKKFTTQQWGLEFYDELDNIQNLLDNKQNPNLQGLSPTQLPGAWVLRDTRPKPNLEVSNNQTYEDDALIQGILKNLAQRGILKKKAAEGRRNLIHPDEFKQQEFWDELKVALGVNPIPGAVVRLPRVIEANVMGQGADFHETTTWEWCEEYYQSGLRLLSGNSDDGGASHVHWDGYAGDNVGFRPLVVFSRM